MAFFDFTKQWQQPIQPKAPAPPVQYAPYDPNGQGYTPAQGSSFTDKVSSYFDTPSSNIGQPTAPTQPQTTWSNPMWNNTPAQQGGNGQPYVNPAMQQMLNNNPMWTDRERLRKEREAKKAAAVGGSSNRSITITGNSNSNPDAIPTMYKYLKYKAGTVDNGTQYMRDQYGYMPMDQAHEQGLMTDASWQAYQKKVDAAQAVTDKANAWTQKQQDYESQTMDMQLAMSQAEIDNMNASNASQISNDQWYQDFMESSLGSQDAYNQQQIDYLNEMAANEYSLGQGDLNLRGQNLTAMNAYLADQNQLSQQYMSNDQARQAQAMQMFREIQAANLQTNTANQQLQRQTLDQALNAAGSLTDALDDPLRVQANAAFQRQLNTDMWTPQHQQQMANVQNRLVDQGTNTARQTAINRMFAGSGQAGNNIMKLQLAGMGQKSQDALARATQFRRDNVDYRTDAAKNALGAATTNYGDLEGATAQLLNILGNVQTTPVNNDYSAMLGNLMAPRQGPAATIDPRLFQV